MIKKQIAISGGSIHYWVSDGEKECLLFIHGATADHQLFSHQFGYFKGQHKVLALDVPSHGLSKPFQQFTLQKAAESIKQILDQEDIGKVHLVGQSMGGYIAQIFTKQFPKYVLSITIIGSSPIQPQYYSRMDQFLLKLTPFILRIYPYNSLIKAISDQVAFTEAGKKYMYHTLQQYSKSEIAQIMEEVYVGIQAYLDNTPLKVPILISYGDQETTGKVKAYSNRWAKEEGLPLVIIPNAAHNANFDNPDFFNQLLSNFLNNPDQFTMPG